MEVDWGEGGQGSMVADVDAGIYFRPEASAPTTASPETRTLPLREVGGKILVGSVEPDCDVPHHVYPEA